MQPTEFRSFLVPNCQDCKILKEAVEATAHIQPWENKLAIPHFISCQKSRTKINLGLPARDLEVIWKQKGFDQFVPMGAQITADSTILTIYGLGRKCPHGYAKIPAET